MKKILLLTLLLLTACMPLASPTPVTDPAPISPLSTVPLPAAVNLTIDSTSEQIRMAMLESAGRWRTIHMQGEITWYGTGGVLQTYQEQVWIDPLNSRYKVELTGTANAVDTQITISDGINIYHLNGGSAQPEVIPYPDFARVGQYIPPLVDGESHPNPIWSQIGTPLSQLAFPSDYSQNKGIFKPVEITSVAGRDTLVIEWMFAENSFVSWRMWLDTQTAVILRLQEFGKDGSGTLQGERVVNQIDFDQSFDVSMFAIPLNSFNGTGSSTNDPTPLVTESGSPSEEDAGDLYFFLQPRQTGKSIQLVRMSGVCVFNTEKCPPIEEIKVPFAFNFTISPLNWSSDGKQAAFAYSDNPNGTPTRMWLFDPDGNVWTSVAEFPYIDPPFWSRDNQWIAFRVQDGVGGEDVYTVQRDGRELKSISPGLPPEGKPYILDGWYTENIIMRSGLPGTEGGVYLVRAANGQARLMFETLQTKVPFVSSPDASLLAYDDYNADGQLHELKIMEPDGANAVTLANFTGGSLYPYIWSPDSRLIAFNYSTSSTNGEPSAEVFVVSRDGRILTSAYTGATVGRLVFSPNGKYLLVEETTSASGGHLFVVDLATMEQKILQAPGLSTDYDWYAPSWRP